MPIKEEFPDYPTDAIPTAPEGFVDNSWRNEMCPSFLREADGVQLFFDYPNADDREFPESPRFTLHVEGDVVLVSDSWEAVVAAIPAVRS